MMDLSLQLSNNSILMNSLKFYNLEAIKPRPYQLEAMNYIQLAKYVVLADEMGLGKSLEAFYSCIRSGGRTLVICPAFLVRNWEREIKKLLNLPLPVKILKHINDIKSSTDANQIFITSYHGLNYIREILPTIDNVIVDEAHAFKNIEAKRTQKLHELVDKYKPKMLILCTGTPMLNYPDELYSLFALCSYGRNLRNGKNILKEFPSYYSFLNNFCYLKRTAYGKLKILGVRNKDELKSFMEGKFIRRTSNQVLDLPELIEKDIEISSIEDAPLQEAFEKWKEHSTDESITRAKVMSAVAKVPFSGRYIADLVVQGQVLVFTEHLKSGELLLKKLRQKNIKCEFISGETSIQKRDRAIELFQKGELEVLLATIKVGGVGFNLINCRNIVFNDHSFVPNENKQAIKRCHRFGQDKTVVIHNLYGTKTDLRIQKVNNNKTRMINEVLN